MTAKVYREFRVKCMWPNTAITLKVPAYSVEEAKVRAEKLVLRMEGGNGCLGVKVLDV